MKKRTFVAVTLLQSLILMNLAEALIINEHFMTSESPLQSCIPPTPTNSFSVDDESAFSWLVFSSFTSGDRIDWEFITPDGSLHDIFAFVPPPFNPTDGCAWGWMDIASLNVPEGSWYVDVYVNNIYAFTEYFEITQGKSCLIKKIYGEHSTETELLRHFRDNILSRTQVGQELIKLYYQWSPVIIRAMGADEDFKQKLKKLVDEVLPMIK